MERGAFWMWTFVTLATAGAAAHAAPGKSIFDDDWTPPKPVVAPMAPFKTPAANGPAAKARLPIPDLEAQARTRKLMREVFAAELADGGQAGRQKLAEKLLEQAERSADVPAERFVLLAAAVDAAVDAGSLPLAFKAADGLGAAFDVDALAVKAEKAGKLNARSVAAGGAENAAAAFAVVDELAARDDFAAASRVLSVVQAAAVAAGDPALRAEVQRRGRDLNVARDAFGAVARHVETLRAAPKDPDANLAVGRYLCFVKADWGAGLPRLFAGSDAKLKLVAEHELLAPSGADAVIKLADDWWELAAGSPAAVRVAMQSHAADWYERAAGELKGLSKARVEKRVESARAAAAAGAGAAGAARPAASGLSEIVVEALIDGHSTLHVTPDGLFWEHQASGVRPGNVGGGKPDVPTYVNGVAWNPAWGGDRPNAKDRTAAFPLRVGPDPDFSAEVVALGPTFGGNAVENRKGVSVKATPGAGESLVVFKDDAPGAAVYRVRLTRVRRAPAVAAGGTSVAAPVPGLLAYEYAALPGQPIRDFAQIDLSKLGEPIGPAATIAEIRDWRPDGKRNVVAHGFLRVETAGKHTFQSFGSWGRYYLYVDGKPLGRWGQDRRTVEVDLTRGLHELMFIRLAVGDPGIDLQWRPPGEARSTHVPPEAFFHDAQQKRPPRLPDVRP
jgi:hypothetical protein